MTAAITLPPSLRFSAGWLRPGLLLWEADPGVPAAWPSRLAFSKPFLLMEGRDILPHPARAAVGGERCCTQQQSSGKQLEMGAPSQMQTGTALVLLRSGEAACVLLWPLGTRASGKGTLHCAALIAAQPANLCNLLISEVGFHPGLPFNSWLVPTSPSTAAS